ncbi:MAG: aminotransferase class I/II-fold pyridoxal phosphate-dependent enzyme [Chloroflexi bacterium]|nr:aminotransferase class I/II-fold pyridoxal phosphate-dependent enzyme [Chloroflexota bacterium]
MLADRTQIFTESVIREMTRLAMQHGAINLAQGYPDFAAPDAIKEAAIAAIRADHNQYAITWGSKSLRDAISAKTLRYYDYAPDPEREITVACGATESMMAAMLAVVNPGDEVIVFEPYYENYVPDAAISGAKLVFVPLEEPDFHFDLDRLRAAFTPRTKAIVINTPNNPSGKVFTREEIAQIGALCEEFDALIITDEIYEHIIYDGNVHVSPATLPGLRDRTITISGLSKTFSVTGWRLGYIIAPPDLTNAIRKVHDFLTVGAPAPLQEAAAIALGFPDSFYKDLAAMYAAKREVLLGALEEAGFPVFRPQGAYYIMADINPFGATDDTEFSRYLTAEIGVAPVPGSSFYNNQALGKTKIRFTFSKKEETLREAAARLMKLSVRV